MNARRLAAWMAVAAALVVSATSQAWARDLPATGWWWVGRPNEIVPANPATPAVPAGGLYVAGTPAGPSGVSAVRFELADDKSWPVLTLTIEHTQGVTPFVDACPASAAWEPAEGGAWDKQPAADCGATKATSVMSSDGTSMRLDLSDLQRGTTLDIVLVPGADPATGQPASGSVTFKPVAPGDLSVQRDARPHAVPPALHRSAPPSPSPSFRMPTVAEPDTAPVTPSASLSPAVRAPASAPASAFGKAVAAQPTGFAYPWVLGLPLVLLVVASYVGWTFTRPMTVRVTGRSA